MTFDDFLKSVDDSTQTAPNADLSPAIQALWHEGRNNWTAAHDALQNDETPEGAWVHAYLHRKEGDNGNAAYWYRRAGQTVVVANVDLKEEWVEIARGLLR